MVRSASGRFLSAGRKLTTVEHGRKVLIQLDSRSRLNLPARKAPHALSSFLQKFNMKFWYSLYSWTKWCFTAVPPQWGAADVDIKVPSGELKLCLFKAWSRSVYSHICYAYCQVFLPCLFLPFQSIHLHFFQNLSQFFPPRREAGDVWCLPPVWNLRAVIWFHFAISSLVLLPSPVTLSVLSFSACWPFLLNFFQKILQYFSLRDRLFCMAPV